MPDLTPDDWQQLRALMNLTDAFDDREFMLQLRAYYGDMDRAERTPRSYLYLHLGMLSGIIERLTQPTKQ